jgi:hypothetical protein
MATVAVSEQNISNHSNIAVSDRQSFTNHTKMTVNLYGTKITVTVTASASVVDEWIQTTLFLGTKFLRLRLLVVGLSIDPDADTLQLCVGRRCLIFQLSRADCVPPSLRCFLLNDWHDRMLRSSKHCLKMYIGSMDLGWIDAAFDNCSVEEIIHKCLGFNVELREDIRTSNWSQEILSDDQILYASVEAYCAFAVGIDRRVWHFSSI